MSCRTESTPSNLAESCNERLGTQGAIPLRMHKILGAFITSLLLVVGCTSSVGGPADTAFDLPEVPESPCGSTAALTLATPDIAVTAHVHVGADGTTLHEITPENSDGLGSVFGAAYRFSMEGDRMFFLRRFEEERKELVAVQIRADRLFLDNEESVHEGLIGLNVYACREGEHLLEDGTGTMQCVIGDELQAAPSAYAAYGTVTKIEGKTFQLKATADGLAIDIVVTPPLVSAAPTTDRCR